jgi:localization factor PodJL
MTSGAPWSVKGIDPKAREVAKDLARRSGMTLGEWLNQVILQDDGPDEVTSESFFADRPQQRPAGAAPSAPVERPVERYEAPEHPADYVERMAVLLERLTTRIETAEARTGQAVSGVEQSVRAALARIEAAEKVQESVAGRVEGVVEDSKAAQATLAERLRKMEEQAAGPRSSEALRALEAAISKVAGQVYDTEAHTREVLAEVEARLSSIETSEGDAGLVEQVVSRVSERLVEAEGRTADAIDGLRRALAALDGRLQSVETGAAPAIEQKLEALAERLAGSLEEARVDMAAKLNAGVGDRFDRMELALGEMGDHVSAAEQRSTKAIEQMGREVLNVAEVLNRRVQAAETRSAEAVEKVGGEMARVAAAMDARLGRSESIHAEALEKLGAEISRITERLGERIANAERRSAQAIDDIGEQVTRVSDRLSQRTEQASGELAERIRQSEERTAKLLEEARLRIDQRLAETRSGEPAAPVAAAAPLAVAPFEASTFPAREEPQAFSDDPFAGFPTVEDEAEPPTSAAGFLSRAFPSAASTPAAHRIEAPLDAEPEAEAPELAAEPEAAPEAAELAQDPADLPLAEFDAAEPVEPVDLDAPAGALDDATAFEAPEPEAAGPEADVFAVREDEDVEAFADVADTAEPYASADEELFDAASPDVAEPAPAARPLTTREVVEQARAAARAAALNGDSKPKKGRADRAEGAKAAPLFSSFGLSRPKRRAGGTLQTFLLVSGGAAALGLAAGGIALMNGQPSGETPDRVARSQAIAEGPEAGELEGLGAQPRASVALAPQPSALAGDAADAALIDPGAPSPDLEALYAEAVRSLEAREPNALEDLKKAANLGHAPAQLYLGKLYEAGRLGVKRDLAEARRWTERAAEGGDRRAMHNVALYYFNGEGGPKNSTTAAQWFRRAAELGLVDSQFNLARLYEEGLGVSQNAAEAYKWFLIASRSGDSESRIGAERVRGTLSAEARTVAERAAVGFRAAAPGATATASANTAVITAQRALSKLGYYQGPTNGEASPALRLAVAAYQRDQGLAATGALDNTTVSRLTVFTR